MSDLVSALRREGKRKRDNMRANGIGHPYVVMVETEAAERIEALEAERDGLQIDIVNLKGDNSDLREALHREFGLTDDDILALLEADDE